VPGYPPAGNGARVVGTVHDSLVAEIPQDRWQESAYDVLGAMTRGVLPVLRKMGCDFDVPLAAECSVGTRWGLSDIGKLTEG
jgi:DNA polymerase I-like protein with 3'-5' exonuclease and polymerase domains